MPTRTTLCTLPDLLRPRLDLVFVGINPGERSAERGHYYAHPGNAFWPALAASPLLERCTGRERPGEASSAGLSPEDDRRLPLECGIGFTDVVKRVATDSSTIPNAELRAAVPAFLRRIAYASPRAICFTSTRGFDAVFPGAWRPRAWGRQPVMLPPGCGPHTTGTEVWVMPSTSGRAAGYREHVHRVLAELAASLDATANSARTGRTR